MEPRYAHLEKPVGLGKNAEIIILLKILLIGINIQDRKKETKRKGNLNQNNKALEGVYIRKKYQELSTLTKEVKEKDTKKKKKEKKNIMTVLTVKHHVMEN